MRGKFRSQSCFLFVCLCFFFAVKNRALKNSLEKNLTIKERRKKKKGGNVAVLIQVTNATSTSSLEQSSAAWQVCSFSFLFVV